MSTHPAVACEPARPLTGSAAQTAQLQCHCQVVTQPLRQSTAACLHPTHLELVYRQASQGKVRCIILQQRLNQDALPGFMGASAEQRHQVTGCRQAGRWQVGGLGG